MIKHMTDMEIQLTQTVKELRMQVAALEVAMADLEDREWVGLTDEEMEMIWKDGGWYVTMFEAIEAKLKEKNNGK